MLPRVVKVKGKSVVAWQQEEAVGSCPDSFQKIIPMAESFCNYMDLPSSSYFAMPDMTGGRLKLDPDNDVKAPVVGQSKSVKFVQF